MKDHDIIDIDSSPFYLPDWGWSNYLNHPLYNYVYKLNQVYVKWITKDEFFDILRNKDNVEKHYSILNRSNINNLKNIMESGEKIDIPFLNYNGWNWEHEGRHRMMAAFELGYDKLPVLFIEKISISERNDFIKKYKDYTFDQMNELFKSKGYKGITQLCWKDFSRIKENLFESKILNYNEWNFRNLDRRFSIT